MILLLVALISLFTNPCPSATATMPSSRRQTLIVGLNPALQRTVTLSGTLQSGSVNRGSSVEVGIGGKGQDVLVASVSMQALSRPVLLQFLGSGSEGDALAALLHQLPLQKSSNTIDSELSIRTTAPCRTCITLVDKVKGEATEIIEPSGNILPAEVNSMLLSLEKHFATDKVQGVAVMGSMPPGCTRDMYSNILLRVCDSETKVLLDTATGIFEALEVCGQLHCDTVIKLNARELCKLAGVDVDTATGEASCSTPLSLIQNACCSLAAKIPHIANRHERSQGKESKVYVAITDGPYTSTLISLSMALPGSEGLRFTVPPLPRPMRNPIGAGDAVSSGTLLGWCGAKSLSLPIKDGDPKTKSEDEWDQISNAFSWGLACGAASCMGDANSVFILAEAESLYAGIVSTPFEVNQSS